MLFKLKNVYHFKLTDGTRTINGESQIDSKIFSLNMPKGLKLLIKYPKIENGIMKMLDKNIEIVGGFVPKFQIFYLKNNNN